MEQKTKDIYDDLAVVRPLAAIMDSDGGKIVFNGLLTVVLSNMNTLCETYTTKSHTELIGIIADMKANRDIARAMSSAQANKEFLEDELKRILEQQ